MELALGANGTRHAQVLRLQPGDALVLFDGRGGQWTAAITAISRREVRARTLHHEPVERELSRAVTLAVGMPANERMDALIEKATELGAARLQPLVCERSVLRVAGERAQRKAEHWRAVAVAACEQCGRNRVPEVAEPLPLREWLQGLPPAADDTRCLLSLDDDAAPWPPRCADAASSQPSTGAPSSSPRGATALCVLSGPEGGFTAAEQAAARAAGFVGHSLGARVLRADTAPLAALAWFALSAR